MQVVQDHTEEFLEKMNSKVLAPQLKALELIPESVECDVLQSKSKEEANAHLLNYLKEDADEESVREVFRIASEKTGYGKMKAFCCRHAKGAAVRFVLVCAHSHAVVVYLSMYRTCVYVNKRLCTVKQDSVKFSVCPSLHSLPPPLHTHRAGAA